MAIQFIVFDRKAKALPIIRSAFSSAFRGWLQPNRPGDDYSVPTDKGEIRTGCASDEFIRGLPGMSCVKPCCPPVP